MHYAELGSVSSGTMKTEDLLTHFAVELRSLLAVNKDYEDYQECLALIQKVEHDDYDPDDDAEWLLEGLFDCLDNFAPPGAYFGASYGDGADFGFWLTEEWNGD